MDIGVWSLREAPALESTVEVRSPGLKLGPGGGGVLLVCAVDTDSASRLANDISRALGSIPVWAWPDADDDAVKLAKAIEDNLFTTIGVFGSELAAQLFEGDMPASLKSANLVLLPSMREIQDQAEARRQLWNAICRSGMVSINYSSHNDRDHKA